MWQLEIEATSASSGSMPAGFEYGAGTTLGDGEARTVKPSSKLQVCSREYLPLRKSGPVRFHAMVARCSDTARSLPWTADRSVTQVLARRVPVHDADREHRVGPAGPLDETIAQPYGFIGPDLHPVELGHRAHGRGRRGIRQCSVVALARGPVQVEKRLPDRERHVGVAPHQLDKALALPGR